LLPANATTPLASRYDRRSDLRGSELLDVLAAVGVLLHDDKLAVVDIAEVFKVFNGPVVPLHQENSCHQAVSDEYADGREIVFTEVAPQALVEAANTIVGIGSTLAVGDAVEEMTIVGALLPHAFHL
ncbi:phosphoglycerate mutase-like protein, partial [Aureobasidium melanogenum]